MGVFFGTKRSKVAIAIFVFGVLGVIFVCTGGIPMSYLRGYCLFAVFSILLMAPEILYLLLPAKKIWAKWGDLSESQHQQRRMERAFNMELTPTSLNRKMRVATFVGERGGKYTTTLNGCSCMDFQKRRVPCKHMYYLAGQLGLPILHEVSDRD